MRQTKYKAWDKDKKEMHQPDEICRIHFQDGVPYAVYLWEGEVLFNFELLEFIGHKDKKGKEVYRGDRVRYTIPEDVPEGEREVRKIIWVDRMCGFQARTLDDRWDCFFDTECFEVIGSIYEEPSEGEKK